MLTDAKPRHVSDNEKQIYPSEKHRQGSDLPLPSGKTPAAVLSDGECEYYHADKHDHLDVVLGLQEIPVQTVVQLSPFECQVDDRSQNENNGSNIEQIHQMSTLT